MTQLSRSFLAASMLCIGHHWSDGLSACGQREFLPHSPTMLTK
jgi:hypothetical protein